MVLFIVGFDEPSEPEGSCERHVNLVDRRKNRMSGRKEEKKRNDDTNELKLQIPRSHTHETIAQAIPKYTTIASMHEYNSVHVEPMVVCRSGS